MRMTRIRVKKIYSLHKLIQFYGCNGLTVVRQRLTAEKNVERLINVILVRINHFMCEDNPSKGKIIHFYSCNRLRLF